MFGNLSGAKLGYGYKYIQISVQCWFNYCSSIIHLKNCNGFVEILFMYRTIHPSECSIQWFSILTEFCIHHPSPFQSIPVSSEEIPLPTPSSSVLYRVLSFGLCWEGTHSPWPPVTGFLPSAQCFQGSSTSQHVYSIFEYLVVLPACYASFSYAKISWFYSFSVWTTESTYLGKNKILFGFLLGLHAIYKLIQEEVTLL